jgi:hypothetical protein
MTSKPIAELLEAAPEGIVGTPVAARRPPGTFPIADARVNLKESNRLERGQVLPCFGLSDGELVGDRLRVQLPRLRRERSDRDGQAMVIAEDRLRPRPHRALIPVRGIFHPDRMEIYWTR